MCIPDRYRQVRLEADRSPEGMIRVGLPGHMSQRDGRMGLPAWLLTSDVYTDFWVCEWVCVWGVSNPTQKKRNFEK